MIRSIRRAIRIFNRSREQQRLVQGFVLCASCWNAIVGGMIADLNSVPSVASSPEVIPAPVALSPHAGAGTYSSSALEREIAADTATGLQLSDPAAPVAGNFEYPEMPDFLRRQAS